ncbi:hypothetical protein IAQ67_28570 (plasmid) [Paenibacillus peoriae]|uniref:Uncharacterized protein n=1 Tax=Paenibacillus peoriae TaxID=59893 RepID=A0A7H0YHA9_9BACL|nr:hypothetical protein [Paenibacillus peoriae]QNR70467.1 hypothetical protein IAQ67_28570 [Paenibacillus peoriae]
MTNTFKLPQNIEGGAAAWRLTFEKMVQYWNEQNGAGLEKDGTPNRGIWHVSMDGYNVELPADPGKPFPEQLAEYLRVNLGYESEYLAVTDDRITFNMIENGDGEPVEAGQDNGTQLYLCDYSIYVEYVFKYKLGAENLAQLLPNAERY